MEASLLRRRAPAPSGVALAQKGFRPFFLAAPLFAGAVIPLWIGVLHGHALPAGYFDPVTWHGHEMVFGFAVAVIAGFLLTAVGNWTGRETAVGAPLLGLAGLWAAGRVAVMLAPWLPRGVPLAVDGAFLPALAATLARPLVAAGNRRNFVMVAIVLGLGAASVVVHLDALGVLPGAGLRANRVGVDLVMVVTLVIAGRVFPMFTRNASGVQSIRSVPALDVACLVGMALVTALDAAGVPQAAWLAGVVGAVAAARTARWGARHSLREPLLWVLHVGHAWIPIGLALRALASVTPLVPASASTHALTVGAIGTLTIGMMARVSLGHTGRVLAAPPAARTAFLLVTAAALVRVAAPVVAPAHTSAALVVAGACWSAAFALFLAGYAKILVGPRVDGKPG
ncbi:MAG: NnrS family protein [Myxococcales bacterium]|nr:NnrS family protein [Myxococcales bacterium]